MKGKNISIAFMCNNIDPSAGGTERVTRYVADRLNDIGYKCNYIYSNIDDKEIAEIRKIKIEQFGDKNYLTESLHRFVMKNQIKVLIVVNQIYQTPKYQAVFKELKIKTEIKIIACLHAAPDNWKKDDKISLVLPKIFIKSRLKRWLCYFYNRNAQKSVGMYYLADKFLLLSDRYIPTFSKTFHIDDTTEHKLVAIPNPCPFTNSYNGERRENVVLIVSRMAEIQKRIFFALKAWRNIVNSTKEWKLIIVGDGPQLRNYKQYVIRHRLDNVHFVGHSNKVSEFYKTSKVFLMTSVWEGQPMSVIEAMHFGCVPVVVDSFEAIHDLVEDGKNGVLTKNNDFDDMCNKLSNLLSNESLIAQYSDSILNNTNELFVEDTIIHKWDVLLKSLMR